MAKAPESAGRRIDEPLDNPHAPIDKTKTPAPYYTPDDGLPRGGPRGYMPRGGSFGPPACSRDGGFQVRGEAVGDLAEMDALVQAHMEQWAVPNGALAVVAADGRLVLARGYTNPAAFTNGEPLFCATPSSVFRLASLSKSFTAAAVMQLVEAGDIRLSDNIVDLMDLRPLTPFGEPLPARLRQVKVWHLLTHVGGWDRDGTALPLLTGFDPLSHDLTIANALRASYPLSLDQIIEFMAGFTPDFVPGTTRVYSNYGYALLGRLVEEVSGRDLERFLSARLWQRLNLRRIGFAASSLRDRWPDEVIFLERYVWPHDGAPVARAVGRAGRMLGVL